MQTVSMLKGKGSPSSWAKTQRSPQDMAPLRLRNVEQEEGGAVAQVGDQVWWWVREGVVMVMGAFERVRKDKSEREGIKVRESIDEREYKRVIAFLIQGSCR